MSRPKSDAPARRVALLIESSRAYGRGLLSGIARYVRAHGRWSVAYRECRLGDFCGYPGVRYSDSRGTVFERLVQEAGRACFRYPAAGAVRKGSRRRRSEAVSGEQQGQDDQTALVRWLQRLPTPVAVMACNSIRGQHVLGDLLIFPDLHRARRRSAHEPDFVSDLRFNRRPTAARSFARG